MINKVRDFWDFVDGRKTYIVAFVAAALNLAVALGWVSTDALTQINTVLGALGLASIRSAVDKV